MDNDFCKEGLIDISDKKDINKSTKHWFITYRDDELDKEQVKQMGENLSKFQHLENFVLQAEENKEDGKHIHIAIELNNGRSKPVRQFIKMFGKCTIHFIKDIEGAREYCCKKYSRLYKPIFFGLDDTEKERLLTLGQKDRPVKLMQKTKEREINKDIADKRDEEETDFDEEEQVKNLMVKVKKDKPKSSNEGLVSILKQVSEEMKKILDKTKDKDLSRELNLINTYIKQAIVKGKKIIDTEDNELVKESSKKMTKLTNEKDKHIKLIEDNHKSDKVQLTSHKKMLQRLKDEREALMNYPFFDYKVAKGKRERGEPLNGTEDKIKDIEYTDEQIKKCRIDIKYTQSVINNHSNKLAQADKASAISPPSSPVAKIKLDITEAKTIIKLETELKRTKGQLKIKERLDNKQYEQELADQIEENKRLEVTIKRYIQTVVELKEQIKDLSNKCNKIDNKDVKVKFGKG